MAFPYVLSTKCCSTILQESKPHVIRLNVEQVELHPPGMFGRSCTMARFFLEVCIILILLTSNQETQGNCKGVFAAADNAGMAPNLYLKELLDKGA